MPGYNKKTGNHTVVLLFRPITGESPRSRIDALDEEAMPFHLSSRIIQTNKAKYQNVPDSCCAPRLKGFFALPIGVCAIELTYWITYDTMDREDHRNEHIWHPEAATADIYTKSATRCTATECIPLSAQRSGESSRL